MRKSLAGAQINNVVFYVDGVVQPAITCYVTGTTAVINTVAGFPITIGKDASSAGRYFKGDLDDIYLYNRPLSAQEVHQLYTPCGGVLSGPLSVCASVPVVYSVSPASGSNYAWSLSPGWTGSSSSSTVLVTPGSSNGSIGVVYTPTAASCINPFIRIPAAVNLLSERSQPLSTISSISLGRSSGPLISRIITIMLLISLTFRRESILLKMANKKPV